MIKITNLNKYYNKGKANEIHVINHTSLTLPDKGLVSFLGPSGSGKTTLLSVVGGLDKSTGAIEYDGVKIKNYVVGKVDRFRKDNIGYVFQNYNLLPNETVYDNLVIALELIGIIDKAEVRKRIEYTLKAVGMYKFRKKQAYALSGGQQQRVAIARALLKNAKIIIADEPTGNLDTENTIEVMKILKKISKNTLVLLVTHNINIAKYYSDKIIEIKDGKVIKEYENDNTGTVLEGNGNTIYLKDMRKDENITSLGSLNIYYDGEEEGKMNIDIIVRNGNYYIQTDKPLKLIESTNLRLVDESIKDITTLDDESNYDTTIFSETKKDFRYYLLSFFSMIKDGFKALSKLSKKGKLINLSFIFMGMLMCLGVICLINFSYVDTSNFVYADNHYQLTSSNHTFERDPMIGIINNHEGGKINNIGIYQTDTQLNLKHRLTFQKGINIKVDTMVGHYDLVKDNKILYGRAPMSEDEIVVDKVIAHDLTREFGNRADMSVILNKTVTLDNKASALTLKIVGIIDGSQRAVFGNENFYINWCCPATSNFFGYFRYYRNEVDEDGKRLYDIVKGEALSHISQSGKMEVLVPEGSIYEYSKEIALWEGAVFQVKGVYKFKEGTINTSTKEYIINIDLGMDYSYFFNGICVMDEDYYVYEGRKPEKIDECVVSNYIKDYQVGDVVEYNGYEYKVVGKYIGSPKALSSKFIQTKESYIFRHYSAEEVFFGLTDNDLDLVGEEEIRSLYDVNMVDKEENREQNVVLYKLLFFVLIFICSIFVYFIMRSRTISLIYDIGVKRSIGATKGKMLSIFLIDTIIITTLFSATGFVGILLLYNVGGDIVNYYLGYQFLIIDNAYFGVGFVCMYAVNIIFGMLPVVLLLRRTPAEICAKYDI